MLNIMRTISLQEGTLCHFGAQSYLQCLSGCKHSAEPIEEQNPSRMADGNILE